MTDFEVMKAMIERSQAAGGMLEGSVVPGSSAEIEVYNESDAYPKLIVVRGRYRDFLVQIDFWPDGSLFGISAWE